MKTNLTSQGKTLKPSRYLKNATDKAREGLKLGLVFLGLKSCLGSIGNRDPIGNRNRLLCFANHLASLFSYSDCTLADRARATKNSFAIDE